MLGLVLLGSGCAPNATYDCLSESDLPTTPLIDDRKAQILLESLCESLQQDDIPALQLTIIDSTQSIWTHTMGHADRGRRWTASDQDPFRLASITKSFVGVLIYRLIEEGTLQLDTPLAAYLPDEAPSTPITVAQLLHHSSGIQDVLTLPDILLTSTSNTSKIWNPHQLARTVLRTPLQFEPGSDHRYSNSNYLLLGLMAEAATGQSLQTLLQEKLFAPLGLSGFVWHPVEAAPDNLVHGYDRAFIPRPGFYELTKGNTSFSSSAYASGNLIATSQETALFFHHLFGQRLISEASIRDMLTFSTASTPMNIYTKSFGRGLFEYDLAGTTYYGHEGQFIGFDNVVVYDPVAKRTIVLLANVSTYQKFDLLARITNSL